MANPIDREVAVFNAALELPPARREGYLDAACGDAPELRQRVQELLRANDAASDFLDRSPVPPAPSQPGALSASRPVFFEQVGSRVGRYKLLEQIGEGGCGTVYLAEQDEPVRRLVALKVIKLGMDTRQVIARFEAERQALALMDHPNIARALDAGATDSGRPFFVMELVRGVKITAFCDQQRLSTRERLELFVQVCHAIQHAHQKGVIHRDIKPSNILVTSHDGMAAPKVIDFGVAKATSQQRLTDKTLFTAFAQFIGTPAYMSPEQAELNDLGVDTRSDIYSLGILLYELLTGNPPFDPGELSATGLDAMRRVIREKLPLRPSTRLSSMAGHELASLARQRQTDPPRLVHLIRGDLDWIVMKALEKERTRRYETANGLALDVKRHLLGDPVAARPPSVAYRFGLVARRHRLLFVAGGAVLVSLVIGAVIATESAIRTRNALRRAEVAEHTQSTLREEAEAARQRAESNARRADEAALESRQTLALSDLAEANRLIDKKKSGEGVAHLARILSSDPENAAALTRLVMAMSAHSWMIPIISLTHDGPIDTAEFSPDGSLVVTGSRDGTARIWDARMGKAAAPPLTHLSWVVAAHFSPQGDRVVTASRDGTARVWDARSGKALTGPLKHRAWVTSARFSPDGRRVVTSSWDGTARIWDAQTGEAVTGPLQHEEVVFDAQFSPDGRRVASESRDKTVKLWDAQTGALVGDFVVRGDPFYSAVFSPDGGRMVTFGFSPTAQIRAAGDGSLIGQAIEHKGWIDDADFTPDGNLLVTASWDHTARVWDAHTGAAVSAVLQHGAQVSTARFSPDGQRVVTASFDNLAQVWDARTGKPEAEAMLHGGQVTSARFSPDGQRVLTSSWDRAARIWEEQAGGAVSLTLPHQTNVVSARFDREGRRVLTQSPDGFRLWDARTGQLSVGPLASGGGLLSAEFSGDEKRIVTGSGDGSVAIWEVASGRRLMERMRHNGAVFVARFSPDERWVASASLDKTARVWDASTGEPVTPPLTHQGWVVSVRFSPDSRKIVTAAFDWTARVWDAHTGKALTDPLRHEGVVISAEFSPNGTKVLTASDDDTAQIWDAVSGRPLIPPLRHGDRVSSARFSPDGRLVATASRDGTARIWDAQTGNPTTAPLQHGYWVISAEFSRDGKRLVTTSFDKTARVWDVASGQALTDPLEHEDRVTAAEFSPDGNRVVTASYDNTARIWDLNLASTKCPGWLLPLAEALSGDKLNQRGVLETTSLDRSLTISRTRELLEKLPDSDPGVKWGRWFLSKRGTNAIPAYESSPGPKN